MRHYSYIIRAKINAYNRISKESLAVCYIELLEYVLDRPDPNLPFVISAHEQCSVERNCDTVNLVVVFKCMSYLLVCLCAPQPHGLVVRGGGNEGAFRRDGK